MSGRDHLVIDPLGRRSEMAGEALLGPFDEILGVVHSAADGLVVFRVLRHVIAEPAGCGTVTRFAAHAFGREVACALRLRRVERVARETVLRLAGPAEAEEAAW